MKKRSIALLLCAAILMSLFPVMSTLAYDNSPITVSASSTTLPENADKDNGSVTLTAAPASDSVSPTNYHWQILIPSANLWVDITGASGAKLDVTYAMVASALSGKTASLRAAATVNGETAYSEAVKLTVGAALEPAATQTTALTPKVLSQAKATTTTTPTTAPTEAPAADTAALEKAVTDAEASLKAAQEALTAAQAKVEPAKTAQTAAAQAVTDAETALAAAKAALETPAEGADTEALQAAVTAAEEKLAEVTDQKAIADATAVKAESDAKLAADAVTAAETAVKDAKAALEAAQTPAAAPVRRAPAISLFADDATPSTTNYSVVINYVFENGDKAADSYTASLAAGSNFSATVNHPTVQGYLPYEGTATETSTSIKLNITDIQADVTYTVTYRPTNVDYTVIHYQQNVDNDNYTRVDQETKQGLTNSTVPEVANTYDGFYALLYEKPAIAADGSTVVEVYYDRYYYLMNFDLDGGYGVEPIYARYGAPINVGEPTKQGYTFKGWNPTVPDTMPAESKTYYATWGDAETVDYTVVYWKENANDSNYSFWGQVTRQAVAGSTVSGADDVPTSITNATVNGSTVNEKKYFTYNAAKTNKDVVVAGDGTTVVNVYYYRNTYHLYFKGISGTCAIEEHTHGDGNCNSYLDCLQAEHTHDENCERVLTCKLTEHKHSDDCYTLTCDEKEHDHATAGCSLICGNIENHTHTLANCYPDAGSAYSSANNTRISGTASNGTIGELEKYEVSFIIFGEWVGTGEKYIYFNGTWYAYNGSANIGDTVAPACGSEENHTHTNSCYSCGLENHAHDLTCYTITCGQVGHVHDDSCYAYTCSAAEHTHTSECYRPCTKLEHTHNDNCMQNRSSNVIWVINAKYEQNIADVWPTADKFSNYDLYGWRIDGINNTTVVSKRVSMTADLCDTSDGLKYANASSGGSKITLYYMFESFDQSSAANGTTRILRNGVYYDSDSRYYQVVNSNGDWSQKQIEGMSPVSGGVDQTKSTVHLYYNRNRSDLMYNNSSDGIVKTVSNIMYEQPLANYKDSDGKLLSAFVPSYPSKLEPNAYEFKGWYTSPECYDGTEYDFSTAKMPNGDLTLYAKWAPITHTVEFYKTQDDMTAGTKLYKDAEVSHGSKVSPTPATPTNGSYTFIGWFYMDGNTEKAIDFANMPINKDLKVYGKWSSNVLKNYTVYYKIQGTNTEVAAPTTGSGLAGITKTFDAKGGTDLYTDYQEGYFPVVKSHSLTIDIENEANNSFTFEYVQKQAVPYTVKYLNKETGEPVATEKTVSDNRKAVVTETFVPVSGMMPDAYQKRLVVSAEEGAVNEIIFYYTEDTTHAYYKITHFTQNTDGKTYTEYASSQAVGDIGKTYNADPMTIPGFTYDEKVEGTVASGELTASGLELKLYYTRNSYPYEVRYLEQGSGTQLATPKTGTDLYGKVISESAIDIANYTPVDPTSQTLTIKIEEGTVAKLNVITFYYKENEATINYEVVGPDGCGTVTPTSETLKVKTGTAQGSTATANENFRFLGWYSDAECTTKVSDDLHYTPTKGENDVWTNVTYYAKFEHDVTTLTITKSGANETLDPGQSFIFIVKGENLPTNGLKVTVTGNTSVTIGGLKVGSTYTITEESSWSWRYTAKPVTTAPLVANGNNVTVANTRPNVLWLDGNSVSHNEFK